jgi:hypothetical protein
MPSGKAISTPAQWRLMAGVAHGMKPRNRRGGVKAGPSANVAKKLISETSTPNRSRLARGMRSR